MGGDRGDKAPLETVFLFATKCFVQSIGAHVKYFILLILITMFYSVSGRAEVETSRFEVAAAPLFGYSTYDGFALGANLDFGYAVTDRWQLIATAGYFGYTTSGRGSSAYSVGTQYNFSDDLRRSAFLGVGWGMEQPYDSSRGPFTYMRYGYRWLISEEYNISWAPTASLALSYSDGARSTSNRATGSVELLRFSITF